MAHAVQNARAMVRSLGLLIPLLAAASSFVACGNAPSSEGSTTGSKVTNIPTSSVIDQGQTGNCWLYATAAWAESLHASATGDKSLHFFADLLGLLGLV